MEILLADKFKDIEFTGFEHVRWNKIFVRLQYELECGIYPNAYSCYLKSLLYKEPVYVLNKGLGNRIFCIQDSPDRKSCQSQFTALCNLISGDSLQSFSPLRVRRNSLKDILRLYFHYIPSWEKTLSNILLSAEEKKQVLGCLVRLWHFKKHISSIDICSYKLLVSYYDSVITESYVVEVFRNKGVKTVTLQHGQFNSYRENVLTNCGVEFASFKSDYMLCWNKFTIDEAIKSGVDKNRLLLAGILGFVGKTYEVAQKPHNGMFGVVLGHPDFEEENIQLVESAKNLSDATGMDFYLKLHPNYEERYFDRYLDTDRYKGIIEKGISMVSYASKVDFSLVGSSSVFAELVYIGHDVMRLSTGGVKDKFRDIKYGKVFCDPSSVVQVYNDCKDSDNEKLFDYLCSVKDVTCRYKEILSTLS